MTAAPIVGLCCNFFCWSCRWIPVRRGRLYHLIKIKFENMCRWWWSFDFVWISIIRIEVSGTRRSLVIGNWLQFVAVDVSSLFNLVECTHSARFVVVYTTHFVFNLNSPQSQYTAAVLEIPQALPLLSFKLSFYRFSVDFPFACTHGEGVERGCPAGWAEHTQNEKSRK